MTTATTWTQKRLSENATMLAKMVTESGFVDEEKLLRHLQWNAKDFGVPIAQRIEAGVNLRIGTPGKVRIK